MKNRINRHRCQDHSNRHKAEMQAIRHALRDPVVTAMYDSPQWQVLRAQVRAEAHGRCQWPGCTSAGFCVDHRTPHKGAAGLFFDRGNLWLLCKPHHDRKTATHDGGFGRDVKPLQFWPMGRPRR